jgi:signal transduction histidine kinase
MVPHLAELMPDWSISTRLTLWYGLTLLALLGLFAAFCYGTFHTGLHRDFDRHLQIKKRKLLAHGGGAQGRTQASPSALAERIQSGTYRAEGIYGTYARLLSPGGEVLRRSPNFAAHAAPLPVRLPEQAGEYTETANVRAKRISRTWEGKPARTHYVPLRDAGGRLEGWLELTGFEWSLHQGLQRLAWTLALGVALSLFLALGGGYLLARRALRPVAALTNAAGGIGANRLDERLPVPSGPRDELVRLAETFNGMIDRLETSFERERRFTDNAAHELLTPLTTMQSEADVTLRREGRPAEAYRAALASVRTDARTLAKALRQLLALSRANRHHENGEAAREAVDLRALAHRQVERLRPRAEAEGIALALAGESEAPVWARADAELIEEEVLGNLLGNALKYTSEGGRVEVSVARQDGMARLRVRDTGAGFAPEEATRLFARFYRSDAPAVQEKPGSGLGLAVARAAARAFGGDVAARSEGPDHGSTFEVHLPLGPDEAKVA